MNRRTLLPHVISSVSLLAMIIVVAHGALPMSTFKAMQDKAPEVLVVKIESVDGATQANGDHLVNAMASVQKVQRSKAGIKIGDTIKIIYTISHTDPKHPVPGPQPMPLIKAGTVCPAYLVALPRGESFAPAAEAMSFETVK